ncbi:MAG: hypothetical protein Q9M10_05190, partial [Mariprofundaceae bacterium]|nr:hypothetical protein [Mariprofundaceae bacterium]
VVTFLTMLIGRSINKNVIYLSITLMFIVASSGNARSESLEQEVSILNSTYSFTCKSHRFLRSFYKDAGEMIDSFESDVRNGVRIDRRTQRTTRVVKEMRPIIISLLDFKKREAAELRSSEEKKHYISEVRQAINHCKHLDLLGNEMGG